MPVDEVLKTPEMLGGYDRNTGLTYFNPSYVNPVQHFYLSPSMTVGHELSHPLQRAYTGQGGTSLKEAGNYYNYVNWPFERQARIASAYSTLPASTMRQLPVSDAMNLSNYDPSLFSPNPSDRLSFGTPLSMSSPVSQKQYEDSLQVLLHLMNP